MNRHHALKLIALISLTTLPLGTVACSKGSSSPTEPAFLEDDATLTTTTTSASSASLVTEESKSHGSDDPAGDDNGGKSGKGGKKGGKGNKPRAGKEFEGAVSSVGGSSLTLANGTRIVVNGQTQWSARGDLRSLN